MYAFILLIVCSLGCGVAGERAQIRNRLTPGTDSSWMQRANIRNSVAEEAVQVKGSLSLGATEDYVRAWVVWSLVDCRADGCGGVVETQIRNIIIYCICFE